ncbi:MAG: ribonuclease E/G [Verrucomicrobia bacterium]|nr:ribonuclease E/G [Verrucomicrobiota bacterium]MBS0645263.1 ribonuclease E/G [Verrucomicrobiota bacterium]
MENSILLNIESKEIRYAHLKNGQLVDLVIERKRARQLTGNIYRGRVTNILHNIQSAFIDIGEQENGFIHMSDILENTKKFEQMFDMDFELDYDIQTVDTNKTQKLNIDEVLKIDQPVLVQVVKEPIGSKGARLTSNISIAGRYLVMLPNSPHRGVSRKIEDRATRERLKKLIRAFEMPQDMGLICRTASVHAPTDCLIEEAHELHQTWSQIMAKFNQSSDPTLLFEESDLIKRAVLTAVDKKFDRLLVDDYTIYQKCRRLHHSFGPEHPLRIEYYRDKAPMFERFNVEREIEKATRRKIWLPSGGYLYFDRTEAMHTVDVNSGRSTNAEGDVEKTLLHINLEAAQEVARQLRLRNVGGLIIVDFIDMRSKRNQRKVLERLRECMKDDPAKGSILGMSEFGLVEMTRQRSRESLMQTLFTTCPYCHGTGLIKTHESVVIEIERTLKKVIGTNGNFDLTVVTHPQLDAYLQQGEDKEFLTELAGKLKANLDFETSDLLHINEFLFYSSVTKELIEC